MLRKWPAGMHTICIVLIPDDNGQHFGDTRPLHSVAEEFGDHHGNRGDDNLFESPIHQAGDISLRLVQTVALVKVDTEG